MLQGGYITGCINLLIYRSFINPFTLVTGYILVQIDFSPKIFWKPGKGAVSSLRLNVEGCLVWRFLPLTVAHCESPACRGGLGMKKDHGFGG